jgi:hypothetical protein
VRTGNAGTLTGKGAHDIVVSEGRYLHFVDNRLPAHGVALKDFCTKRKRTSKKSDLRDFLPSKNFALKKKRADLRDCKT